MRMHVGLLVVALGFGIATPSGAATRTTLQPSVSSSITSVYYWHRHWRHRRCHWHHGRCW